jgi:anti-sigma factor RsiW
MNPHRPFEPERDAPLLSGYVDGELGPADRALVEAWLDTDEHVREEVARLVRLNAFTDHLVLRQAPAEAWDEFLVRRPHRTERSLGWLLLLCAVALLGGFLLLRLGALLLVATIPVVLRLGVFVGSVGLLLLLISVLRERSFARKRDRYDDVIR